MPNAVVLPIERRLERLGERMAAAEERSSEQADAIGELNHAYGRLLGELSNVKGDLADVKAICERIEARQWSERSSGAIMLSPQIPSSRPAKASSEVKVSALLAIVVALSTALAEVIKFALHVH